MKKLAVCTVGVVLALLLGGSGVDQGHAAGKDVVFIERLVAGESQGVLLDLAGATTWTINGKSFLFVPVPHSDVPWQPRVLNPMKPSEKLPLSTTLMRRSTWFMTEGTKMIIGALLDKTCKALVFMHRLDEDRYRMTIESTKGEVLLEAEGVLMRLDSSTGYSELNLDGQLIGALGPVEPITVEGGCICKGRCRSWFWSFYSDCEWECTGDCTINP